MEDRREKRAEIQTVAIAESGEKIQTVAIAEGRNPDVAIGDGREKMQTVQRSRQ